jgi:hypothetical protein
MEEEYLVTITLNILPSFEKFIVTLNISSNIYLTFEQLNNNIFINKSGGRNLAIVVGTALQR